MSKEVDRRNFAKSKIGPEGEAHYHELAKEAGDKLPGNHQIRIVKFDSTTGTPAKIVSNDPPKESGNHIQRALSHVKQIKSAYGFAKTQPSEFEADPRLSQTSSGAVTVHLHQLYKGIPIFQANVAIHFDPNDLLEDTVGSTIEIPDDISVLPKLTAQEAAIKAANYIATPHPGEAVKKDPFGNKKTLPKIDLSQFSPQVVATFDNQPSVPTVMEGPPFEGKIKANLVWFPIDREIHLSWETIIAFPAYIQMYRTLIDAENGEILYCHQLSKTVLAKGNVYLKDGGTERQMMTFPCPLDTYKMPPPKNIKEGFPSDWVDSTCTEGNNVKARLGDRGDVMTGSPQEKWMIFNPKDPTGDDQKVLNIFFYNCFMHDFFYLLGFTEEFGNFQKKNFTNAGFGSDAVDARAHSGEVYGTANMSTPVDGSSPIMNMGLVADTQRHTAFDSSVVFHEYMHGVTNRLVGGGMDDRALESPQSGGMGEGWGDYIACTINDSIVVGSWVIGDPHGIRQYPYDDQFPDDFGKLGKDRYDEVHNIGELWCATLMQMNRNIGKELAVQLVVDALKLSRSNPGFLDMRDSILQALEHMKTKSNLDPSQYQAALSGIWNAFAKFGMGPQAKSNGAQLSGIEADFTSPLKTQGKNKAA